MRLLSSCGAGGVLYLTPMVFHGAGLSSSQVGQGLALAALLGAASRLLSGSLLDQGWRCSTPVLLAALIGLGGDGILLSSHGFGGYLLGQGLVGIAMGLYWPAVELAVPLSCAPVRSARAFALVRSGDALGVAAGSLAGALLARLGWLRGIYSVDMAALLLLIGLLLHQPLAAPARKPEQTWRSLQWATWLPALLPLLLISLLATAMPALMQSALPLDLVRGALARPALGESQGALLIGLQLGLLVLLQWPVGQALARGPIQRGLALSLGCFALGSGLLAASSLHPAGLALALLAQLPLALGEAAFLPTATEAVIRITPLAHQGLALALFTQCFALSALGAPLIAGLLLDGQGHGTGLWLGTAALNLMVLPLALGLRQGLPREQGPEA